MSTFEAFFGRTAQIAVLEYLINNRDQLCYLSGIAEATGLSHSSVARVIAPLLEKGIVIENHIGKKMRAFILNEDCESLRLLIQLFDNLNGVKGT